MDKIRLKLLIIQEFHEIQGRVQAGQPLINVINGIARLRGIPMIQQNDVDEILEFYNKFSHDVEEYGYALVAEHCENEIKGPIFYEAERREEEQRQKQFRIDAINHITTMISNERDELFSRRIGKDTFYKSKFIKHYSQYLTESDKDHIYEFYTQKYDERTKPTRFADTPTPRSRGPSDRKPRKPNPHKLPPDLPTVPTTPDITGLTLKFPYKSRLKRKDFANLETNFNPRKLVLPSIPDKKTTPLKKKFMRPSFAIQPYSWEMDHLQTGREGAVYYLFFVNINTRYLYAFPTPRKTGAETIRLTQIFIKTEDERFGHPVKHIRCDGDRGFNILPQTFPNIKFYMQSSPFTNHNKIVDGVMRTLRNALGPGTGYLWDTTHDDIIQQLIFYYNNTHHRMINMKPIEMHTDIDKEWKYIREKTEELNEIKKKQISSGLHSYKRGDRLMVYLDYGKTSMTFDKRRRKFDHLATFVKYQNGNAIVKLDKPINGKTIYEIPLYYTSSLPKYYPNNYGLGFG